MTDVIRSKIKLYMELENLGNFEVVAFNSSYSVSGIPSASCVLAIGRDAYNVSKVAAIHKQGAKMGEMHKAKVYAQFDGDFSKGKPWPDGSHLVFEGRLTGIGARKAFGQIQFVAHLIHWVADMSFSSTVSGQSHPTNPTQYSFRSIYKVSGAGGKSKGTLVSSLSPKGLFRPNWIIEDLWGKALQPWLCEISNRDAIQLDGAAGQLAQADQKNDDALSALKRFEGEAGDCGLARSKYTPALSLNVADYGGNADIMAKSIAQSVGRDQIETYASTTLWDVLVGLIAPRFMFVVVPLIEKGIVVPFVGGLRETYAKEIKTQDYEYIDLSAFIPRPIKTVGIVNGKDSESGARMPGVDLGSRIGIGGTFTPDEDKKGMILLKAAPSWLSNIPVFASSPSNTTGIRNKVVTGSATADEPGNSKGDKESGETAADAAENAKNAYDRYAQALYIMESLKGRQGILAGKLRWDIAPGSNIRISGSQEQFIGAGDPLGQSLVGSVVRVSHGINAESGKAGTTFQMAHIRTEVENTRDSTSIEKHPLYNTVFTGAPMVDSLDV